MQDTIPSQDQLRKEIIGILKTEWRLDESAAIGLSASSDFLAARRKYHYLAARGRVDHSTPALLHVFAFEWEHFKSDEAVTARLKHQIDLDAADPLPRRKRRPHPVETLDLKFKCWGLLEGIANNAKTRGVTKARRSYRPHYPGGTQKLAQRAHQASL